MLGRWLRAVLVSLATFHHLGQAQIMSVDLGHEFFKVALMRQGVPLEIVLNTHSKRKTTTAVSFFEAIRTFGDDALAHQGKSPGKVPMFFHLTLGRNYTAEDVQPGGRWWTDFGLGDKFYTYDVRYEAERGAPVFNFGGNNTEGEEVLAHIFHFCRKMAEASGEGKAISVRDLVVTMPSDATLRQRQAVVAAGEIAGLRVLTLVHEGAAFAVQRAVDFSPEKGASEFVLFYNLGSRKSEVSVVKFESRQAGMVAGKTAPVVTVLGSTIDFRVGGHLMDLKIANVMLKKFQEKNPKLAAGVAEDRRALRKLLSQAAKTKAILSSNKVAPFIVESLYEDTDFQATIAREDFEEMCKEMFSQLTEPIEKALKAANVTMKEIGQVEVVGGAWRVPKVQQVLSDYIESQKGEKLPLGQHLNGEEAAALGAALVAANSSSSFRVKKIFFTDITQHEYAVQVAALSGEWEKNVTVLYPAGTALGGKKKLAFSSSDDFLIRIFEDGVLVSEYEVAGLQEVLTGRWKEYNLTGAPKVSVTVPLEMSGIIEVKGPVATVEETYWVNVTKEKPKTKNATNATKANTSKEETKGGKDKAKEKEKEEAKEDEEDAKDKEGEEKDKEEGEGKEGEAKEGEDTASSGQAANESNQSAAVDEEPEVILKQKKKKHEKKLTIKRRDYRPMPLSESQIATLRKKLEGVAKREAEVMAVAGIRNELEAALYGCRDKLEREDIIQVSTEQQREAVTKLAAEVEDWLSESGHTKSDYEQKLASLQDLMGPMEERAHELEARSSLKDSVEEAVQDMQKTHAIIEKNMTWVPANKTEPVLKKLVEFEEWWKKKSEQQDKLPLHEAPAFTVKDVQERISKLQKEWDKLKKLKKPKEVKPKAAKADKNATDSGGKAEKGKKADEKEKEEPLPESIEATEEEIASIREKKAAAVENEDFDKADKLKKREKALQKHLEKLKGKSDL